MAGVTSGGAAAVSLSALVALRLPARGLRRRVGLDSGASTWGDALGDSTAWAGSGSGWFGSGGGISGHYSPWAGSRSG
ncbi:MAG: hypothetical protein ACFCBW_12085, partial [Candidatus Competibacterales bacterium]